MSDILKVSEDGNHRVRLESDADSSACNPRTSQDNLCHVVTQRGTRFIDVDKTGGPLSDGWNRLKDHDYDYAVEVFTRWARTFHGVVTLDDRPHDGANAVWYMLPAQFTETTDPAAYMKCERDEYRAWAAGEVYGYIIEHAAKWDRRDGEGELTTWGQVEDCWGYIGYEYAKQSALSEFERYTGLTYGSDTDFERYMKEN